MKAAVGGSAVVAKMTYMQAILARGIENYNITTSISLSSLKEFAIIVDLPKTSVLDIHPYWKEYL